MRQRGVSSLPLTDKIVSIISMHHMLLLLQPADRLSECRLLNVITVPERRGRRLCLWLRPSNYAAQDRKERLCRRWRFGWQVSISGSFQDVSALNLVLLRLRTSQRARHQTWAAELGFFICRGGKTLFHISYNGSSACPGASFVNSVLNPLTFPDNTTVWNTWRVKGLAFTEGMHIARSPSD